MHVLFTLVGMTVFFVSYNTAELAVVDISPTMDMHGEGTTIRRLRRYEYTMKDLDKKDNGDDEERTTIDISKLDDALNAKLDVLMSSDKMRNALKNIDDEEALFKKWNQNEATSKAILARLQKPSAESITNVDILSKFNTFLMKEKQLDDLMSAKKIEKALADPKDREALFKTWYTDEATSKSVLARLQRTPTDTIANKKIISKFNTFITKEKELDELLDPVKIKNGMKTFEGQEALFKTWHVDDATALAVSARLDQNRMPNFPIILKFNDYRTRLHYNKVLAPWVDTKMLDETSAALKNFKTKPMRELFQAWYDKGITAEAFTSALNTIQDVNKRKSYVNFEHLYTGFIQMKVNEAKRAAKKAAEAIN